MVAAAILLPVIVLLSAELAAGDLKFHASAPADLLGARCLESKVPSMGP